jgi:hypothetical protein
VYRCPRYCIDQEFTESDPLEYSVNKVKSLLDTIDICFKKRAFSEYDDDSLSLLPSLEEVDSSTDGLVVSAGNATLVPYNECFELEFKEPRYNYHGPKIVLPKKDCPVTIYTADTIGTVKSR